MDETIINSVTDHKQVCCFLLERKKNFSVNYSLNLFESSTFGIFVSIKILSSKKKFTVIPHSKYHGVFFFTPLDDFLVQSMGLSHRSTVGIFYQFSSKTNKWNLENMSWIFNYVIDCLVDIFYYLVFFLFTIKISNKICGVEKFSFSNERKRDWTRRL